MKKKLLLIGILMFILSGCFGYYRIRVNESSRDLIDEYPRMAKAGETVRITTVIVDDGDLFVNIDGVTVKMISEGIYEFVMPEHDIEIKLHVQGNGLA